MSRRPLGRCATSGCDETVVWQRRAAAPSMFCEQHTAEFNAMLAEPATPPESCRHGNARVFCSECREARERMLRGGPQPTGRPSSSNPRLGV